MGIIGDKLNAQAVLALGDNFYTYGTLRCLFEHIMVALCCYF